MPNIGDLPRPLPDQKIVQMDASLGRSARVRFMLDTIYAVKNNRKTKGVLDDQDEKIAPLRKWVRGLVRKSSSTSVSTVF